MVTHSTAARKQSQKDKTPPERGFDLEAEVGIEPAYADLQSAA